MKHRPGVTVIELLVSMALILFIMAILSQAFIAGLDTFQKAKSMGDMDQNLRSMLTVLARDLTADHFNSPYKLSALPTTPPPSQGFFFIRQGTGSGSISSGGSGGSTSITLSAAPVGLQSSAAVVLSGGASPPEIAYTTSGYTPGANPILIQKGIVNTGRTAAAWGNIDDGADADDLHSYYATQHALYFTINLGGYVPADPAKKLQRRENYLAARAPNTPLSVLSPFIDNSAAVQSGATAGSTSVTLTTAPAGLQPSSPVLLAGGRQEVVATDSGYSLGANPITLQSGIQYPDHARAVWGNVNYHSQFAEVAYFLRPNGSNTTSTATGGAAVPLYNLMRRQAVIAQNDAANPALASIPFADWKTIYYDMSCSQNGANLRFNSMADVADPTKRSLWTAAPRTFVSFGDAGYAADLKGADILLTDVVSFYVGVIKVGDTGLEFPLPTLTAPGEYDTAGPPFANPIRALEISVRVWDRKTRTTRQVTLFQDM